MILRPALAALAVACLGFQALAQPTQPTSPPAAAQPAQTLDEMIEQLRANSSDTALRERIIVRVARMRTKPAISEDARRAFVQGTTSFTGAQGASDYQRAAERYGEALAIAPWWGDAYFNRAKAREQSGDFDAAIRDVKWYLLSAPSAADARIAQDQIYALEEKKATAARRRADEAARVAADPWANIEGARYVCPEQRQYNINTHALQNVVQWSFVIRNHLLEFSNVQWDSTRNATYAPTQVESGRITFADSLGERTFIVTPDLLVMVGYRSDRGHCPRR